VDLCLGGVALSSSGAAPDSLAKLATASRSSGVSDEESFCARSSTEMLLPFSSLMASKLTRTSWPHTVMRKVAASESRRRNRSWRQLMYSLRSTKSGTSFWFTCSGTCSITLERALDG